MSVHQDAIGNLVGRYEADAPGRRTLLLGSHLDSVRDAGKYDGPLGVLIALECVARLHRRKRRLPFAIEVYGFADEEGLRYHTAYLGSSAVAGILGEQVLTLMDADGIPLARAIEAFGGDPATLATCRRRQDDLIGYCEVHIEQGPILEEQDMPVGVVSAIQGQTRSEVTFTGSAGHAGTVPMGLRRDALVAASEFILAVETCAQRQPELVATVGQIAVYPGASNVIPGSAVMSLDLRHPSDHIRLVNGETLEKRSREIATQRGLDVDWKQLQSTPSVPCNAELVEWLGQAVAADGLPILHLASGAGHDAAIMATLTASAMLFLRCKDGISHSPEESVSLADVARATAVLARFLELVAERYVV
jgi:allantoate deiminase